MRNYTWRRWETNQFVEVSEEADELFQTNPQCPICGRYTEESRGKTDFGHDQEEVEIFWFDCNECEIQTQFWTVGD